MTQDTETRTADDVRRALEAIAHHRGPNYVRAAEIVNALGVQAIERLQDEADDATNPSGYRAACRHAARLLGTIDRSETG